ncbi:hypothetical protein LZ757_03165 [Xylella fastidiosa subsp. morus]|uniref:Uncharacterized protein n=1 Tax=Xylella fastidiosa subsp. fastidiosa TaxID=644356 RepID=A0AAJ5QZD2_XYLFS|nr:hypothetical protein [Xylella fastidiosa]AIC13885.1 hypothetical protein P303_07810 [Xylella fastidiosa MUL0034]AIC13920.1 hypothetical protein P303_08060 [Xylella fastidiosa MUL0034]EWG15050.1 hypothetical protein P910_001349 [Xylella fastidiosa Mul-MD]KQH72820.1 hypothetical protein AOT81_11795 [Xylella fastidiosa]UIN28508.1 hypothetical protein IUD23_03150 [Xylella fastidiosa subsp. morus]
MTRESGLNDVHIDHIFAIELALEGLLPLLIDASPKRNEAIALLQTWAELETSKYEEIQLGELANTVLKRVHSMR